MDRNVVGAVVDFVDYSKTINNKLVFGYYK